MNDIQPTLKAVKLGGMEMTTTGFKPGGPVTKEGILAHLMSLNYYQAGINWCVGDLILMGEEHFGEDWTLQAIGDHLFSMSPETQKQCQWVAQRFPHAERLNDLTWSHHLIVAGIEDVAKRTLLLESCLVPSDDAPGRGPDKPMTVTDLRRAVKALKGDDEDPGKRLEAVKRAILKLDPEELRMLLVWIDEEVG